MAKRGKIKFPASVQEIGRFYHPRKYQYTVYIYCEDEKTEVAYFEQFLLDFPEETVFLKAVGTGRDPLGVVNIAAQEKQAFWGHHAKYPDETWAVFDVDDANKDEKKGLRFTQAIQGASKHGIQVAWSHEVFEVWLLLHLQPINPKKPLPRQEVYQALEKAIQRASDLSQDFVYQHGNPNVITMVQQIGDESKAILNALTLEVYWETAGAKFLSSNPRTNVHKLVSRLRDLIDYYSYQP